MQDLEPFALLTPQDCERVPAHIEDAYPLTMLQGGMLFHNEYSSGEACIMIFLVTMSSLY